MVGNPTWSNQVKGIWSDAGFTGPVTYDPPVRPKYIIGSQSLDPGTTADCTSGITVTD
jgi:hypothetical protein